MHANRVSPEGPPKGTMPAIATALTRRSTLGRLRVPDPAHEIDKQIAATAIHDLTIVTRNSSDFRGTGVRLETPFSPMPWAFEAPLGSFSVGRVGENFQLNVRRRPADAVDRRDVLRTGGHDDHQVTFSTDKNRIARARAGR